MSSWCCCSWCSWVWPCASHQSDGTKIDEDKLLRHKHGVTPSNDPIDEPEPDTKDPYVMPPQSETWLAQFNYMDLTRGDVLESIETTVDQDTEQEWITVRNVTTGTITRAPAVLLAKVTDINDEPWYFAEIANRADAESILMRAEEGAGVFLVRTSADKTTPFVLSVKELDDQNKFKVTHYRISQSDKFYGTRASEQFVTVSKMIESYLNDDDAFISKPCPKNRGLEINRDDLEIRNEIGRGQFGVVKSGTWRNREVAIKELILSNTTTEEEFIKEIQLMNQFKHKNIVSLYGVCTDTTPYVMVLEFMENGCLLKYIKSKVLTMTQNISVIQQIAGGMEFLERYKVLHRDLAARNILVGKDLTAKIADFGLSRMLQQREYYVMTSNTKVPILWMAVESLTKRVYTVKSDVWSFGILAMEIFTRGKRPYSEYVNIPVGEMFYQIEVGLRMTRPEDVPKDIFAQISSCWLTEPKNRPTFVQLNNFFTSYE